MNFRIDAHRCGATGGGVGPVFGTEDVRRAAAGKANRSLEDWIVNTLDDRASQTLPE